MRKIYKEGVTGIGFTPDKNKIVLIKRRDFGIWYLPGGGKEKNESEKEAVSREFEEETGADFKITRFQGIYDFRLPIKDPFFRDIEYVYVGIVTGSLEENEEARKVKYFDPNKLPLGFPFWQKHYINDALKRKKHHFPVTQKVEIGGLIKLLAMNPQLALTPFKLLRKLSEDS